MIKRLLPCKIFGALCQLNCLLFQYVLTCDVMESPHSVMAKMLDSVFKVEFELQSDYFVHFWTPTLEKVGILLSH